MNSKNNSLIPRVEIKIDGCKGCKLCAHSCPKKVLQISDKINELGYNYMTYKGAGCIGCGICYYSCPEPGVISVFKKESK